MIAAAVVMSALFALSASAQSAASGVIKAVSQDGTITIGAGQNVGFEQGDVLVIQRQGAKLGLAHVNNVEAASCSASMMKLEQDFSVKAGDIAAYQLISAALSQSFPSYTTNVETGQPANIMKREWLSPPPAATNYDNEINIRTAQISKNAHDRGAMIRLADAYFKKGWYVHSVKWNQRAIEEKPNAPDNDKLLAQIIRAYGYLNEPDKQILYMDYLQKHYPSSVFVTMTDASVIKPANESKLIAWVKDGGPITDQSGFQKGGMRSMQKSLTQEVRMPGSGSGDVGGKLLHGSPELMPLEGQ